MNFSNLGWQCSLKSQRSSSKISNTRHEKPYFVFFFGQSCPAASQKIYCCCPWVSTRSIRNHALQKQVQDSPQLELIWKSLPHRQSFMVPEESGKLAKKGGIQKLCPALITMNHIDYEHGKITLTVQYGKQALAETNSFKWT